MNYLKLENLPNWVKAEILTVAAECCKSDYEFTRIFYNIRCLLGLKDDPGNPAIIPFLCSQSGEFFNYGSLAGMRSEFLQKANEYREADRQEQRKKDLRRLRMEVAKNLRKEADKRFERHFLKVLGIVK